MAGYEARIDELSQNFAKKGGGDDHVLRQFVDSDRLVTMFRAGKVQNGSDAVVGFPGDHELPSRVNMTKMVIMTK
jgi:hypothetical protein